VNAQPASQRHLNLAIQVKLALAFGLIWIALGPLSAYLTYHYVYSDLFAAEARRLVAHQRIVAGLLENRRQALQESIQLLARNRTMRLFLLAHRLAEEAPASAAGTYNEAAVAAEIEPFATGRRRRWLRVTNLAGNVLIEAGTSPVTTTRTVPSPWLLLRPGSTWTRLTGIPALTAAAPVFSPTETGSMLGYVVAIEPLDDDLVLWLKGNTGLEYAITELDGTVLLSTTAALSGRVALPEGGIVGVAIQQGDHLISGTEEAAAGVVFLSATSAAPLKSSARDEARRVVLTTGALGLLPLTVMLLAGRHLIRPLTTLTEKMAAYTGHPPASLPRDQVTAIEATFDEMVAVISDRETRLSETANRLQAISATALDAQITIDQRGRILSLNPAAEKMLGYAAAELAGKNVKVLLPPPFREQHDGYLEAYLRTGRRRMIGRTVEVRAVRASGEEFPCELAISEVRLANGERLFHSSLHDLTARKQSEEKLRRLVRGVEAAAEVIVMTDPAGRIFYVNPAFTAVTGYQPAEAMGHTPRLLKSGMHPASFYKALWETILRGEVWTGEVTNRRKDGTLYEAAVTIAPVLDNEGRQDGFVALQADITERKHTEEALERLTAMLMDQTDELRRSNEELQQFAYIASHDLQEPVRMVKNFTELLERRYGDRLDDSGREFIGFAIDGARRMQRLIQDLLEYSRVGTHGREPSPIATEEVLMGVLANLKIAIDESAAAITHGPLPEVMADESQIFQLLQNLVANAIKFRGPSAPQVHIEAERQGDHWLFAVRDNGIGIDPAQYGRVFQVFQRLHSRDEYPGSGIGLAVCKRIVQRHGGQIWVESQPGAGSTFYFTLPVAGPPAAPATVVAGQDAGSPTTTATEA
jgi:PAS domain S-box-containing protein